MQNSEANQKKDRDIGLIVLKIFLLLILTAGALFISFWTVLIGAFEGNKVLSYAGMGFTLLGVPLLVISLFIRRIKGKTKLYLWIVFLTVIIAPVLIHGLYKSYDNSFTRMSEAGTEVKQYQPFMDGTKAVYLDEKSHLSLQDPLPKLDGARALYPVYSAFAQATYPNRKYDFTSEVGYNNTIDAYDRLMSRQVDIIFVVSPSEEQKQDAEKLGVKMKFTPIGQDAFVFFVNAKNPVNDLTSEQIQSIYGGKITNWRDVGGNNQSIRAFQRNSGSGSQSAFLAFMSEHPVMNPPTEDVVCGMGTIIEQTANYANYANSIGFSFRYFSQTMIANNDIKLLSIDGVYPSTKTIASGEYPLSASFYAVTLEDNDNPDVNRLIEWILSPQGQKIVEKTGYIPVK